MKSWDGWLSHKGEMLHTNGNVGACMNKILDFGLHDDR